jgi:hypothetical protein
MLGAAAVPPFWAACGLGAYALEPRPDTAPAVLTVVALSFFAPGATLTRVAASALRGSWLYAWAVRRPALVYPLVVGALLLVLPGFIVSALSDPGDSGGLVQAALLALGGVELSVGLTWLMALRPQTGAIAAWGLALALAIAVATIH